MKSIIISFLLCLPFLAISQFKSSIDLLGSADINYRDINFKNSESYFQSYKYGLDGDVASVKFRFGANYNYKINDRLVLKTGLRMANIGYKSYYSRRIFFGQYSTEYDGFSVPYNVSKNEGFSTSYNHFFIEVPLMARYEFKKSFGKFQPYAEAGLSGQYYLTTFSNEERNGVKELYAEKFDNINKFQMSANIGLGFNYNVSNRMQLFFQPTFRYNLTPMFDSAIKEHPFSVGFEMGLRFKLN